MLSRLGNVLYWLGTIIAVLAIAGALVWNGVTFSVWLHAKQAQVYLIAAGEKWKAQETCIPPPPPGHELYSFPRGMIRFCLSGEIPTLKGDKQISGSKEELEHERTYSFILNSELIHYSNVLSPAKSKQEFSLFMGAILAAVGLLAYGIGWVARYVLRGQK